jgi:uncharacterized membrane protein
VPPVVESAFTLLFKYPLFVFAKGRLVLGARWPAGVLVLAVLATAWSYSRAAPRLADRAVLAALRTAALAALLLCLCRPGLQVATAVPQQSFVGILLDDSRSMRIADDGTPRSAFAGRSFGPQGALFKELSARFKLRIFRFADTADRLASVSDLAFDGARTSLVGALDQASQELSSVPLSGLVLVTDGADNGPAGPLDERLLALRARKTPVFTVGLGRERFARDVELVRAEMPSAVLKGTSLTAEVRIAQRGLGGSRVRLQVEDEGRLLQTQEVELPADGEAAAAHVPLTLSEPGPRTVRFRIAPLADEPITENNQQDVSVLVRDRREKILYLEGEPRFELKFIRRAVQEDDNLQVVCLERTSQNKFLRLDVDEPEELASGFPRTREELFRYRGLVLGSVEAGFFTPDQLDMIAAFVGERGGGLLTLGGRHSFAEGGYRGTSLAEVLPVVLEEKPAEPSFLAEVKVEPTPAGLLHGTTRLAAGEAETTARWKALPALSTLNPVRRTRPGAVSLLVGKGPGLGGPQVVLSYQRYGAGKSLAFTAHDSWLWRMHADVPLGDGTHETLWRQLLRFLVSGVPGPVSVSASPERTAPGSSVAVVAAVSDDTYVKVNDAQVVAHVTEPSGAERPVPLEWAVGKDGEYRGSFVVGEKGRYAVRVEARRAGKSLGGDAAEVAAADLGTEYFAAEMRRPLLERIAEETGGRFYTPDTVASLPADLGYSGGGATVQEEKPLWDMPALYLLIVSLLSAEWGYRKRRGLA